MLVSVFKRDHVIFISTISYTSLALNPLYATNYLATFLISINKFLYNKTN